MEHHNKDNSWNDRWQLEGLYLEKLHQQHLLFLVFSSALKNKKIKVNCPSRKQIMWPWEPAVPQLLFQTVILMHAHSPDCSSVPREMSKVVGACFHFMERLLQKYPFGKAQRLSWSRIGKFLCNKFLTNEIYEQRFMVANIKDAEKSTCICLTKL